MEESQENFDAVAATFVREIRSEVLPSSAELSAGLIVAAYGSPAVSVTTERSGQLGICVAMQAIANQAYEPSYAANIIVAAFNLVKGRPVRFLKYADAAVLDWCWKNGCDRLIDRSVVVGSAEAIASDYSLPNFDQEALLGSLEVLHRNQSLIKWDGRLHLAEEVKVWR